MLVFSILSSLSYVLCSSVSHCCCFFAVFFKWWKHAQGWIGFRGEALRSDVMYCQYVGYISPGVMYNVFIFRIAPGGKLGFWARELLRGLRLALATLFLSRRSSGGVVFLWCTLRCVRVQVQNNVSLCARRCLPSCRCLCKHGEFVVFVGSSCCSESGAVSGALTLAVCAGSFFCLFPTRGGCRACAAVGCYSS